MNIDCVTHCVVEGCGETDTLIHDWWDYILIQFLWKAI